MVTTVPCADTRRANTATNKDHSMHTARSRGGVVYEVTYPCARVPERFPTDERVEAAAETGPDARPNWLGNLALVARDSEPARVQPMASRD